ncbi:hypothetical protein [Cellulosimicrobium sp. NPDC057127]|uniref:hypothetical protein n=1 Tax=Cellulosimicrobium sp. NPDC057127 TaxID=3346026 RepID=UPI003633CCCD
MTQTGPEPGAAVYVDLVSDALVLTIAPDEPIESMLQVRVAGRTLRQAIAPVMAQAAVDVRVAEAERIAELLHERRFGAQAADFPDTFAAGMLAASRLACTGAHPGSTHGEALRSATARAALAGPPVASTAEIDRVRRDLQALAVRVASLADATGTRPPGWNEAVREASTLVAETVAHLPAAPPD